MESVLALIFSAENMRMLVLLVFGFSCFVWLKMSFEKRIDGVELSLNKQIGDLRHNDLAAIGKRIDDLKYNDFAHLNNTIEALTFTLEKNGYLKREDKEYIDSRLD
ncbi:MAG: hypothetical protein LBH25_03165 [Fibromonadaceae bacterium]|jgi:hypothetical protein|nr:hypothetical protein [Fibromonadaceae bacterium]